MMVILKFLFSFSKYFKKCPFIHTSHSFSAGCLAILVWLPKSCDTKCAKWCVLKRIGGRKSLQIDFPIFYLMRRDVATDIINIQLLDLSFYTKDTHTNTFNTILTLPLSYQIHKCLKKKKTRKNMAFIYF